MKQTSTATGGQKVFLEGGSIMKIKDKRLAAFLAVTLVIALAACALRAIALMTDFDYASGYFVNKNLSAVSAVLAALCILIAAAYPFLGKARLDISPSFHGAATYVPSGLLAIAIIFYIRELISMQSAAQTGGSQSVFLLIVTVGAAIGSAVYLFLNAFLGSRYSCARGTFGICVMVFLILCAARIYFDKTAPINVPNKNVAEPAYVAAAIFFTAETRLSLGREKWRLYGAFGLAAIALCAYSSVPELVVYLAKAARGVKDFSLVGSSLGGSILAFALSVFITARVAAVAFLNSNLPGALASYAAELSSTAADAPMGIEAHENQISIDDIIDANADSTSEGE